ncbi:class I SAM-dependent methyltransferase [Thermomonas brevis]
MARIFTRSTDDLHPDIDKDQVLQFFNERAGKVGEISYKQAVIYQDKNGDLAERRDSIEKGLLLQKLLLTGGDRLLDIGCGTGRWTESVIEKVGYYHGTDLVDALLEIARSRNAHPNANFTCLPCTDLSLDALGEKLPFSKIIMLGVIIYLNDSELNHVIRGILNTAAKRCRLLLREPVGISQRLTIKEHFSEDMAQSYNAIYRTEDEIMGAFRSPLESAGFKLLEAADLYQEAALNNRSETKQKYFLFERN